MSEKSNNHQLYFLLSPISWAVYFTAVYLLSEAACKIGLLRNAMVSLTLILMVLTLGLVILAGYKSRQRLNALAAPEAEPTGELNQAEMAHFSAQVGLWLSGLFFILTLGVGATVLVLQPC